MRFDAMAHPARPVPGQGEPHIRLCLRGGHTDPGPQACNRPTPGRTAPAADNPSGAGSSSGTTRTGAQKLVSRSGNQNVSGIVPISR